MLPERYNLENFVKSLRDPRLMTDEMKRITKPITHKPQEIRFRREYGSGIDFLQRDWDYLVILDACRYDIFKEVSPIDGELDYVISKGSHSLEFCTANFAGNRFYDTVYVTANGYGARVGEGVFHDLIFTDDNTDHDFDVLHSTYEGIAPGTVYNTALKAIEKYPNKRIIVHFMQPHGPYLGDEAARIRDRIEGEGLIVRSRQPEMIEQYSTSEDYVVSTLLGAARMGYVSESELKRVYIENLNIVLKHVKKLINSLNGKIIITSDHGNYLGEKGKFGHPKYEYSKELRQVPWLTIDSDSRPEIIEMEPIEDTNICDESVEKRLRDLGYTD